MARKRVHVIVVGQVQGVFFRVYTREEAMKLKLAGWVRNRPDGSVEAVVEGEPEAVNKMVSWFYRGSPMSSVSRVELSEEEVVGESDSFEINYY